MFTNNNKTSYTPITVGSIQLQGNVKNTSPKINYFSPTPPASPTYKDNSQGSDEKSSKSDKDINVIMQNVKQNQFLKLNLEMYDYFWHDSLIFVMCIYNKYIPVAIYLNSDVVYENSILVKLDEVPKNIKDDCIIYQMSSFDNLLEKYDKGIVIKINSKIIHYKFQNELQNYNDIRHSVVPLFLFDSVINGTVELDNKFEPILNFRLNILNTNINNVKVKYESSYKAVTDFEGLFYNNMKLLINKIQNIKQKKKQLMDDYNYYSKNNIIVNGNNKSEFDSINSKLVGYFAYYEKFLSYDIIINKVIEEINIIESIIKSLNDDMINN